MFFKSAAKRSAPSAPPAQAPAAAANPAPVTVEGLGQQLRDALPTRRLHSLSLCDHEANVLWLSEGVLGPDEHALVVEALGVLGADTSLPCHEMGLEDGRLAVFLPVRAPLGEPVGIAMILADGKSVGEDTIERMTAPQVRSIMQRLAVLLKPTEARGSATARVPILELDALPPLEEPAPAAPAHATPARSAVPGITAQQIDDILEFELDPATAGLVPPREHDPLAEAMAALDNADDEEVAASADVVDMVALEFETPAPRGPAARTPPAPPAPPAPEPVAAPPVLRPAPPPRAAAAAPRAPATAAAVAPRAPAAAPAPAPAPHAPAPQAPASSAAGAAGMAAALVNDPNLMLELLPYAKLRAGGQTRRFQVLARASAGHRDPAALDALVLQRLLGWLAAHRPAWSSQPTSFTVNLSIATLEDERFAQKMAQTLNSHGIAAEAIGYEISEALCAQRRAQVERFITQCDKVGSWVIVDDFSFDSQVLPLLKSKALRLVKIDSRLTSNALKDKLSQALVVATVQASKVLGIHCAAKKVDSQAALQWLTAIGCDFAQGQALAPAQPLDSLASSPDPTGISAMALPS